MPIFRSSPIPGPQSVAIDNSIDTHNSCNEKDFTTLQEKLYSHQQNKQQTDPGSGPSVPALPETDTLTPSPSKVLSFLDDEVLLRTAGIHWPVTNNHHVVHTTPQLWLNDSRATQYTKKLSVALSMRRKPAQGATISFWCGTGAETLNEI
ncbi:hypothetical protein ACLKA6_003744 [Drosophila palustris]